MPTSPPPSQRRRATTAISVVPSAENPHILYAPDDELVISIEPAAAERRHQRGGADLHARVRRVDQGRSGFLRARLASEHHEDAGPGRKVLLHPLSLFRRKRASSCFSSHLVSGRLARRHALGVMPTQRRRAPEYTVEAARFEQLSALNLTESGVVASSSCQMASCIDFCLIGWDTKRCLPGAEPGCTSSAVALRLLVHLHVKIAQALVICPWLHAGSDTSIVVTLMGLPEYLARERFLHSMCHQERLALVCIELLPQPPTSRAIRIWPIQRWHPQPIAALASASSKGWKLPHPFCSVRGWGDRFTAAPISLVYFRLC